MGGLEAKAANVGQCCLDMFLYLSQALAILPYMAWGKCRLELFPYTVHSREAYMYIYMCNGGLLAGVTWLACRNREHPTQQGPKAA